MTDADDAVKRTLDQLAKAAETNPAFGDPSAGFDSGRYILDENGNPKHCQNLMEWAEWMETADAKRIVAQTPLHGRHGQHLVVSTVFLGLDHDFSQAWFHIDDKPRDYQPRIFETMVFAEHVRIETPFGEVSDTLDFQNRYRTRADALTGHTRAVAIAVRLLQEQDAKLDAHSSP